MPGLPALPDFPQLVRWRSKPVLPEGFDGQLVNKVSQPALSSRECWSSGAEDLVKSHGAERSTRLPPLAANGSENQEPAPSTDASEHTRRRSTSKFRVSSNLRCRTPRGRSCDSVRPFGADTCEEGSGDEATASAQGPSASPSPSAPQTPRATPPRPSSSSRGRAAISAVMAIPRASAARAASAARRAASLASPRLPPPRPTSPSASPQLSANEVGAASAAEEAPANTPPLQRPAGAETPRGTPRGSIMRQMTPRRLVPKFWGKPRAEVDANASERSGVATPSRSRASIAGQDNEAQQSEQNVGAEATQDTVEVVEIQKMTQKMLEFVYEQPLGEEQASVALRICPEVEWLVQCTLRAPLPPGWRKRSNGSYVNGNSGEKSSVSPVLDSFAKLARLALHARQTPDSASTAAAWVRRSREDSLKSALQVQEEWSGPHLDRQTGAEYYHCLATGISSWTSPYATATYLAHVADRLLQSEAFPRSPDEPSLEEVAQEIQTARQGQRSGYRPALPQRPASASVVAGSRSQASPSKDPVAALADAANAVAAAAAVLSARGPRSGTRATSNSHEGADALTRAAAALNDAVALAQSDGLCQPPEKFDIDPGRGQPAKPPHDIDRSECRLSKNNKEADREQHIVGAGQPPEALDIASGNSQSPETKATDRGEWHLSKSPTDADRHRSIDCRGQPPETNDVDRGRDQPPETTEDISDSEGRLSENPKDVDQKQSLTAKLSEEECKCYSQQVSGVAGQEDQAWSDTGKTCAASGTLSNDKPATTLGTINAHIDRPDSELHAEPAHEIGSEVVPATVPAAPPSPLSAEDARKLAEELIMDEGDDSNDAEDEKRLGTEEEERAAPQGQLLGGQGQRPAVPKLCLSKALPGPLAKPLTLPPAGVVTKLAPEPAHAAPLPPAPSCMPEVPERPSPATAAPKESSKLGSAPVPPINFSAMSPGKGNVNGAKTCQTYFVGGA